MYEARFEATDDADWAQAFELIDNDTNEPLEDATDAEFVLVVKDRDGCIVLRASTEDDTIDKPDGHIVAWRFTVEQMGALCPGATYRVGCTMITDDGTVQVFIGSLVILDGDVN